MRKVVIVFCAGMAAACATQPPAPAPIPTPFSSASAVAQWEELVRRQPSASVMGNLGYAYYLADRHGEALWALEQACLLEPGNALWWERLAALLETGGQSVRALAAMRQARQLRERAVAAPPAYARAAVDLWPAGMARTEVRQAGAGLVELVRVPPAVSATGAAPHAGPAPLRPAGPGLEISNGNGVRGMAAAWRRRLQGQGVAVTRLTNTRPFDVARTRLETGRESDPLLPLLAARLGVEVVAAQPVQGGRLRLVLGRDLAQKIKKPPGATRRQAP